MLPSTIKPDAPQMTISDIEENIVIVDKSIHCMLKALILHIKREKNSYPTCSNQSNGWECKKAMTQDNEGKWFCSKCNVTKTDCNYRYILQVKLHDHTNTMWAIAFDEGALQLMQIPAKELSTLQFSTPEGNESEQIIRDACNKEYIFSLSCKKEMYDNESQLKVIITGVEEVNFVVDSAILLSQIKQMVDHTIALE